MTSPTPRSSRSQGRRRRAVAGSVAGLSAVALLAGVSGSTLARWQDSTAVSGAQITTGNLDVEALGQMSWQDVTKGAGTPIELASFRTAPLDNLQGTQSVDVGLQGDNLKAIAFVDSPTAPSGEALAVPQGVELTYRVTDRDGKQVVAPTPVGTKSAPFDTDPSKVSGPKVDGTPDYTVTINAKFDENTTARARTEATALLGTLRVNLQQAPAVAPAPNSTVTADAKLTTDTATPGTADEGDVVTFTLTVQNTGNVALTGVVPSTTSAGVAWTPGKVDSLAPGATATFTGTHTFTAGEVTDAKYTPTHTVTYTPASGGNAVAKTVTTSTTTKSQGPTVASVTSMGALRGHVGAAADADGAIYAIGGATGSTYLSSVERYDTATNEWAPIAAMSVPRHAHSVVSDGRYVYAIGGATGSTYLSSVERYDTQTKQWETSTSLPFTWGQGSAVVGKDGTIYVIGGYQNYVYTNTVWTWKPGDTSWTQATRMNATRYYQASAVDGKGRIYAIGGRVNNSKSGVSERYDPATKKWENIAVAPKTGDGFAAVTGADGMIYLLGGGNTWRYNPDLNTWAELPNTNMPNGYLAGAVDKDGNIYGIGGLRTANVYRLTP